jgi:hypothetical protein
VHQPNILLVNERSQIFDWTLRNSPWHVSARCFWDVIDKLVNAQAIYVLLFSVYLTQLPLFVVLTRFWTCYNAVVGKGRLSRAREVDSRFSWLYNSCCQELLRFIMFQMSQKTYRNTTKKNGFTVISLCCCHIMALASSDNGVGAWLYDLSSFTVIGMELWFRLIKFWFRLM